MSAFNNGNLVGTIVSEITHKVINDNMEVVSFRLAPVDNREGDSPIPVVAYNALGASINQRYAKGDTIGLTTRLRYVTWTNRDGQYCSRLEVIATDCLTVRRGQISTAKRMLATAGIQAEYNHSDREPATPSVTGLASPGLDPAHVF